MLIAIASVAWCQTPVITSILNSASYQPTHAGVNTITSIFGTNLAAATASAQAIPLPLQLAGTSVTVGGVAAPLFYVSPTQINFLAPGYDPEQPGNLAVIVSTSAGSSSPYIPSSNISIAGGLFTNDSSGCGQGAVLNVALDGSLSINSPANSASPGDWIAIYGTGLVLIDTAVIDPLINIPAPSNPPMPSVYGGDAQFDFSLTAWPGTAGWIGLAPGYVGLDQFNVQIPAGVREGCAVPLLVAYDNGAATANSQPVTIAIRQGGGPCVDPPSAGYGQVTWQKNVSTTASGVVSETDTMTASLQASPGQQAPPAPVYGDLQGSVTLFGPACPVPGYRSLGAGTVTVQGPGLPPADVSLLPFQPGQVSGLSAYQATLPSGTIKAGAFTIAASGGPDVGAFQAPLNIGTDIQIQTALAGVNVSPCEGLSINWSGGDPNSWVTVKIVQQPAGLYGGGQFVNFGAQTRAANNTAIIDFPGTACGVNPSPEPVQIVVEVDPDPSEITTFSATGLSLGGQASWRYVHTFQASLLLGD